jgi:hypothetical protein
MIVYNISAANKLREDVNVRMGYYKYVTYCH